MSSLYQTPKERATALRESTKTGNFLQDSWTDMVSSGISLGEDGSVKRDGAAWWFQGFTPGADSIADQKKGIKDSRIIQRAVQDSGLTDAQIRTQLGDGKLTVGNVSGTIAEGQRARGEQLTPAQIVQRDRQLAADGRLAQGQENANTIAQGSLDLSREQGNNTLALARLDNKFDRETASADRNLTLRLGQMQSDLADKRLQYDRETRSMDKRDRAIAQLMSGLGSLGGAFTL